MSSVPPVPPPMPPIPATPTPPAPLPSHVPNYLAWSIIATILGFCLCCPSLVTGIVAIVYASKVNSLLNQGQLEAAQRASASAKTWCWVTTVLAVLGLVINIVSIATGGLQSYMSYMQQFQNMQ